MTRGGRRAHENMAVTVGFDATFDPGQVPIGDGAHRRPMSDRSGSANSLFSPCARSLSNRSQSLNNVALGLWILIITGLG